MEIWKDIKNYENHYEVSSYGKIRAKYREFIGKDGKVKKYHVRILKPDLMVRNNTTYERVTLSKNYKTQRFQVHRLVAQHFLPNPEYKPFINHIDNNGRNNHLENLEWCTHSENMLHAQKQGRLFQAQSTGGIKSGEIARQKMIAKVNKYIGTTKHYWYVVGICNSEKPIISNKKASLYLKCILCNTVYERSLTYFENDLGVCCLHCAGKLKKKSR